MTRCADDARDRLDAARAALAASVALDGPSATLGSIVLRPDQIETVRRVRAHLRSEGGCLLADDVGTGKTYVALAVAREWSRPLVVHPASLRATWEHAARRAGVRCGFTSHEALSRGGARRSVVRRCRRGRVAPLSSDVAAPRRARRADGARSDAAALRDAAAEPRPRAGRTAGAVPRRVAYAAPAGRARAPRGALGRLARRFHCRASRRRAGSPSMRTTATCCERSSRFHRLRARSDAGDGGVLLQLSLVRAWASSRAALAAAVRRRQHVLAAIEQCHQEGRRPTRRELRSWSGGGDVQLGFATLLAATPVARARSRGARASRSSGTRWARRTASHHRARRGPGPDAGRGAAAAAARARPRRPFSRSASRRARCARYWSAMRGRDRRGTAHRERSADRERSLSRETSCSPDSHRGRRARAHPPRTSA